MNEFEDNSMPETSTPINRPETASTSVDPDAKPFQSEAAETFTPIMDDGPIPTLFPNVMDDDPEYDKEPDDYDNEYVPAVTRMEVLIEDATHELVRVKRIVQVCQMLLALCAAAAIIYIATKTKGKVTPA